MNTHSLSPKRPLLAPKRVLVLLLAGFLGGTAMGQTQPAHGIDALLDQALNRNPAVAAVKAEVEGAEGDVNVARLQRYPTFTVGSESDGNSPVTVLNVEQPLWSGGALTARIKAAEVGAEAAKAQVDVTKINLALRLIDIWQGLLTSHNSLVRQEESVKLYDRFQNMMRRRVEARVSPTIELDLLRARSLQARVELSDSQVLKRISLARLEQLVGNPIQGNTDALVAPVDVATLQAWAEPLKLEELMGQVTGFAAVKKAELDALNAAETLKVRAAQQWPQLVARYRRQLTGSTVVGQDRESFSVGLSYTPGAGFSTLAQIKADTARLKSFEFSTEVVAQDVSEQVRVDWENLRRELTRQQSQQQTVDSNQQVLESYERQFVAGRKSWQEVLNAVRELSQAEVRVAESKAASAAYYYRLRLRTTPQF